MREVHNRFKNIFICTVVFGGNNHQVECISCVYTLPRPFLSEAGPGTKKATGKRMVKIVFNLQ